MYIDNFSDEGAEDDVNEYSELNSSGEASNIQIVQPMAPLNYPTSNYVKHKGVESSLEIPESYIRASLHTPDLSVHSVAGSGTRLQRERVRSNNERDTQNKSQVYIILNSFFFHLIYFITNHINYINYINNCRSKNNWN